MICSEVWAEVESGYDGVQRLLLDLERFGYVLLAVNVFGAGHDDGGLHFDAWVAGPRSQCEVLQARLSRHQSVRNVRVRPAAQVGVSLEGAAV